MKKIYLLLPFLTLFILLGIHPATASGELIITELMYDASGSDTGREWVEVYNPNGADLPVVVGSGAGSWRFSDNSNHILHLAQGQAVIPANGLTIIAASSTLFLQDYPSYTGSLFTAAMSLPNASGTIGLTLDSGQTWLTQLNYDSAWGGAGDGNILEKINPIGIDDATNWRGSIIASGTPGELASQPPLNQPPIAMAGGARFARINRPITFDAGQSSDPDNDPLSAIWDFGDGTTASGMIVSHSFNYARLYSVTLIVSDGQANASDTTAVTVMDIVDADIELNVSPTARLSGDQSGTVGQLLSFSATESSDEEGDELRFIWDFGDAVTSTSVTTTHSFGSLGTYTVSVSVSDGLASSSAQLAVIITENTPLTPSSPVTNGAPSEPTAIGTIIISEMLPNPVGDDRTGEFIELQNTGSNPVQLSPWALVDSRGRTRQFQTIAIANITLNSNAFLLIPRLASGITLGNVSGTVELLRWDNSLADTVHYGTAPEGKSWARQVDNTWAWTTPTPGAANTAPSSSRPMLTIIRDLLDDEPDPAVLGAASSTIDINVSELMNSAALDPTETSGLVEMTGVVSMPPGIAGKRLFYVTDFNTELQQPDATAGILINITSGSVPKLGIGDVVIVRGDISQTTNERQIKVSKQGSITIIGHTEFKVPESAAVDDLTPESVGSVVAVSGEVTANSGKNVTIDDGTGEIVVVFPSNGSIPKPKIKQGQILSVVGVVRVAADGLRVMPRQANEVEVHDAQSSSTTNVINTVASGTAVTLPTSVSSPLLPIGLAGAGLALGGVVWWVRRVKN